MEFELDTLNHFRDDMLNGMLPGVRYAPTDAELVAFLKLFKEHPEEFKSENAPIYFPIYDAYLESIDPATVHEGCLLHESHTACIFLAKKKYQESKKGNQTLKRNFMRDILVNQTDKKGLLFGVIVKKGHFVEGWRGWLIEEIVEYSQPEPNEQWAIYRATDLVRESARPLPVFKFFLCDHELNGEVPNDLEIQQFVDSL